ncbi:MAG: hypothetical protein LC660_04375 [Desulfobacteraceae bacterium]|nr:hypothetical protein [Desulfobacteraceae bacterium]
MKTAAARWMTGLNESLIYPPCWKESHFFCLAPGGTRKTTLIRNTLEDAFVIDLLEIRTYREYLKNPSLLAEQKLKPVVVIDEVQKLPEILDEVHRIPGLGRVMQRRRDQLSVHCR